MTIKDQVEGVREDVERTRNHPFIPNSISIYGYSFDVKSEKTGGNRGIHKNRRGSCLRVKAG